LQQHRFPYTDGSPFNGTLLNRSNSIEFSLNGKKVRAFEGDTLLSALLANGCKGWWSKDRHLVILNQDTIQQLQFHVIGASSAELWFGDINLEEGMQLETNPQIGILGKLARALKNRKTLSLDTPLSGSSKALELPIADDETADFVVIGGGIAGMQAALSAANLGKQVTVLERTHRLGGMCDYYGQAEDEEAPASLISRLVDEISTHHSISVLHASEAIDVRENRVLAFTSLSNTGELRQQKLRWIGFNQLALAVGTDYGSKEPHSLENSFFANQVYRLAADFGVMPSKRLSVLTGGNSGYRLAQLLLESGIEIEGLCDPRLAPTSRHIDFAKAVGVRIHWGETLPLAQERKTTKTGRRRQTTPVQQKRNSGQPDTIVSHAPKPNLHLWIRAGGACKLDEYGIVHPVTNQSLNSSIVGSAFGTITQQECLREAELVVSAQLDHAAAHQSDYSGMYKYESSPKTLDAIATTLSVESIRQVADVPSFSSQPKESAISEYLFERSGLHMTIEQMRKSKTILGHVEGTNEISVAPMSTTLRSWFERPLLVNISALEHPNMAVGQYIYDSDGINQKPQFCGVIVRENNQLMALVETDEFEQLGQVFVQARSRLFAATLVTAQNS